MTAENEEYCQNSANAIVECAAIWEAVQLAYRGYEGKTVLDPGPAGECGARWGHSPCGARRVINYLDSPLAFQHGSEVWAVDFEPEIVLPRSGKTVVGSNFATSPHAQL